MNTQNNKTAKVSLEDRKNALKNKAEKTAFDFVKLANVTDKIENKTASKVYKNCIANQYIFDIIGKKTVPTFKQFSEKMPIKTSYSNWDGYKAFAKFNVKEKTAKKVTAQNTKEAKK